MIYFVVKQINVVQFKCILSVHTFNMFPVSSSEFFGQAGSNILKIYYCQKNVMKNIPVKMVLKCLYKQETRNVWYFYSFLDFPTFEISNACIGQKLGYITLTQETFLGKPCGIPTQLYFCEFREIFQKNYMELMQTVASKRYFQSKMMMFRCSDSKVLV